MNKISTPKITIIVPKIPEQKEIKFLETLKKADYPKNKIELLITQGRNPSLQRNKAIDLATGEIIFFFDDDSEITKNYFKQTLKHYENQKIDAIGGPAEPSKDDGFLPKQFGYVIGSYLATQSMSNKFKGHGKVRKATEKELILCNFNIRKKSLGKSRFDERLYPNEENELYNRLMSENKYFLYDPELKIYRKQRSTLFAFAKQFFKYGYSRVDHLIIRPASFSPVFITPPLFLIYLITLGIFSVIQKLPILYYLPLILYGLAAIISAIKISLEEDKTSTILITPPLFLLLHASYGLGMIISLLNFKKTKRPKEVKINKIKLK